MRSIASWSRNERAFVTKMMQNTRRTKKSDWNAGGNIEWTWGKLGNNSNTKGKIHCTKNEVFHERFLQYMWPNPQFPADLVTFTEETLMANFNFSAIIRSENQKFPTLNVRKKL